MDETSKANEIPQSIGPANHQYIKVNIKLNGYNPADIDFIYFILLLLLFKYNYDI